ncbi:MAG: hypothetical protein ACM3XM_10210 [Mycobacterium leprae]
MKEAGIPTMIDRLMGLIGLKPNQTSMLKFIALGVAVGILLLYAPTLFGVASGPKQPSGATLVSASVEQDELARLERDEAAKLADTLSLIDGAGKVHVVVSMETGPTITPLTDRKTQTTTQTEKDTAGSTRQTTSQQEDVTTVTTKGGTNDAPAVGKRIRPQIAGVLIVAEGAREKGVQAKLHAAAVTALGISADKIRVEAAAEGR